MATDDGSFFGVTEEEQFGEWLHWAEDLISAILLASQRIGLAIAAGGFAVAGSNLIDRAPGFAYASLALAGVFGVWFAVGNLQSVKSRR